MRMALTKGTTDPGTRRRSPTILRRISWSVADQAVSSLSNLLMGVIVARSLGPEGFGAFSLAFVTYSFILSAVRGPSTDPLLVRFSGHGHEAWSRAVASASGSSLALGAGVGLVCVGVGLLLPPSLAGAFIALGVGLPGILLQDSYRFAFFSQGQGRRAFVNDLLWGGLQVGALALVVATGSATAVTCLLVFGATGTLAAGIAVLQSRILPHPLLARAWLTDHRDLGAPYLLENLSVGGARQLRMFAVGAVAGLAAVGEIRAAEILMGPFLVVLSGLSQSAVPEASQVLVRAPERILHFCAWLSVVPAAAAVAWSTVIYLVLPLGVGDLLLGDALWQPAAELILPITIVLVFGCFHIACTAAVRAMGAARRSLFAQVCNAGLYVVGGSVGALQHGAVGSSWGIALASLLGSVIWWRQLNEGLAEHRAARPVDRHLGRAPW